MPFTLNEIMQATQGSLIQGRAGIRIKSIAIDSRRVKKGGLFIAIKGKRLDGHQFIPQALKKGAGALIVSDKLNFPPTVAVLRVGDTTRALGKIAQFYRQRFDIPVIAVTGSSGKTTAKEFIAAILQAKYKVLKNFKTENNQIGVPLTLLKLRPSHEVVVLEFGTNRPGDIEWLAQITKPTAALFTNIGESHLEHLKSPQGVYREKLKLINYLHPKGTIIFNNDDNTLRRIHDLKVPQRKLSYSVTSRSSYQAQRVGEDKRGNIEFKLSRTSFLFKVFPRHNVYNALGAVCCARLLDVSWADIERRLRRIKNLGQRFTLKKIGRVTLIDDTYNSNPLSLRSAVETLDSLKTEGKKILVCADMLELGKDSRILHRQIGRDIGKTSIKALMTFGPEAKYFGVGFRDVRKKSFLRHYTKLDLLNRELHKMLQPQDVVLIKGSRGMKMERVVEYLVSSPRRNSGGTL